MIYADIKIRRFVFFRERIRFRFDLAALKSATAACYMDLGEFYTSEKLSDDARFFYHSYGAWLHGRAHTRALFDKYVKVFRRLRFRDIQVIKAAQAGAATMSEKLREIISEKASEKKNSLHGKPLTTS